MSTSARTGDPVTVMLERLHQRYADLSEGQLASYIPELTTADPNWFGICLVTTEGAVYETGDTRQQFTIQSISKAITYATVLEELGADSVLRRIGVEPTGDPFNSIVLDPLTGRPSNPMVNAGAIAAAGLVCERYGKRALDRLLEVTAMLTGHRITIDESVLRSETATGDRNRAIAYLLRGSGALTVEVDDALSTYFGQCSMEIDARDLAMLAATLANGGVQPDTLTRVFSTDTVRQLLAVMASCGMYDGAGEWLFHVGLPAKSGVGGGIIAVLPGQFGLAVFSPLLDGHGNSVRGVRVCRDFVAEMDLHLVASTRRAASPIRSMYSLAQAGSTRHRSEAELDHLSMNGGKVLIVELQGLIDFKAIELVSRRVVDADMVRSDAIIDFRRADAVERAVDPLLASLVSVVHDRGGALVFSGLDAHPGVAERISSVVDHLGGARPQLIEDADRALEWCEQRLLPPDLGRDDHGVDLADHELFRGLSLGQQHQVLATAEHRRYERGETVLAVGSKPEAVVMITSGMVSAVIERTDGSWRRIATAPAGTVVGELAVLNQSLVSATVLAESEVDALLLSPSCLAQLGADDPALRITLGENLLRIVARRADQARRELIAISG